MSIEDYKLIYKTSIDSLVDIIVLTHNHKDVTERFLDLLYTHTDSSLFFLILVDNGSSDETPGLLEKFLINRDNATLFLHSKNLGIISGRNFAYQKGSSSRNSDYVMFLDNDQFVRNGWLEQHLSIAKHYDIIGVEAWQLNKYLFPSRHIHSISDNFNYVGCGGMTLKRKVIKKIGLFDERFNPAYFEDPDIIFRAHDVGFSVGWNSKAKIYHLGHQTLGQLQSEKQRIFFSSWEKFRDKWQGKTIPTFFQIDLSDIEKERE